MKTILEIAPLIGFFVAYKVKDIYVASLTLVILSLLQIITVLLIYKKIDKMSLIGAIFAIIFGSITYYNQDSSFIKMKVTIINAIMGSILIVSYMIKKPVLGLMLSDKIKIPEKSWGDLTFLWSIFFIFCAILNYYVAFNMSEEDWVKFKVFGLLGLNIIMTIITAIYISKKIEK